MTLAKNSLTAFMNEVYLFKHTAAPGSPQQKYKADDSKAAKEMAKVIEAEFEGALPALVGAILAPAMAMLTATTEELIGRDMGTMVSLRIISTELKKLAQTFDPKNSERCLAEAAIKLVLRQLGPQLTSYEQLTQEAHSKA